MFAVVMCIGVLITTLFFNSDEAGIRFWGNDAALARARRQSQLAEVETRLQAIGQSRNAVNDAVPSDEGIHTGKNDDVAKLLRKVQDNAFLRATELDAWRSLFVTARELRSRMEGVKNVPMVDVAVLLKQSAYYRGNIVNLQGVVRRVIKKPKEGNAGDLGDTYELWLWPGANVCVVCCETLPPGFPVGDRLSEPVEVDAIHFKLLAYQALDDIRVAPLLVGVNVKWLRPKVAPKKPVRSIVTATLMAAAPIAAAFLYWYFRRAKAGDVAQLPDKLPEFLQLVPDEQLQTPPLQSPPIVFSGEGAAPVDKRAPLNAPQPPHVNESGMLSKASAAKHDGATGE